MSDDRAAGDEMAATGTAPVTGGRLVVVVLVVLVTLVQLFGVTVVSIPADSAPAGIRSAGQLVLSSYFEEEWKLFAPNPVNADSSLLVQAAWLEDGTLVTGDWHDLSAVDDGVVRHSVGAPRSAYLTGRLVGTIDAAWSNVLRPVRNEVRDASSASSPLRTQDVAEMLTDAGVEDSRVAYVRDVDLAVTTYVTDALRTLEPDREIVAVRYGVRYTSVPGWEERGSQEKVPGVIENYPWRTPSADDPARREATARYLDRHA